MRLTWRTSGHYVCTESRVQVRQNNMRFTPLQRVRVLAVFLSAAAIAIGGCEPLDDGDKTVTISGYVEDAQTGLRIDSAMIYMRDTVNVSGWIADSLGTFWVEVFPFSDSKLFARKVGYLTAVVPIADGTRDITGLVVLLEN